MVLAKQSNDSLLYSVIEITFRHGRYPVKFTAYFQNSFLSTIFFCQLKIPLSFLIESALSRQWNLGNTFRCWLILSMDLAFASQ